MYAPKLQANLLGFMLSQKSPKQTKKPQPNEQQELKDILF